MPFAGIQNYHLMIISTDRDQDIFEKEPVCPG